jgi:hypothetical protein
VESDRVRRRKKGPSKVFRDQYGHTPLSPAEEARRRGVEIIAQPTAKACKLLDETDTRDVAAILHVTC